MDPRWKWRWWWAREVMVIWAAEEPKSVRENLERSFAIHQTVHLHAFLEDAKDEILLLHSRDVGDIFLAGLVDLLERLFLRLLELVDLPARRLVQLVERGISGLLLEAFDLLVDLSA